MVLCPVCYRDCYVCYSPHRLGDQIASVNGISLLGITHAEAVKILRDSGHTIEFVRESMFSCVLNNNNNMLLLAYQEN